MASIASQTLWKTGAHILFVLSSVLFAVLLLQLIYGHVLFVMSILFSSTVNFLYVLTLFPGRVFKVAGGEAEFFFPHTAASTIM